MMNNQLPITLFWEMYLWEECRLCLEYSFLTQFRQLQSKDYIYSSLCQKIAYTGKLSVTSHFLHIFPWSIQRGKTSLLETNLMFQNCGPVEEALS